VVIGEDEEEIGRGGWGELGEKEEREKEEPGFHLGGGWQVGEGETTGNCLGKRVEARGGSGGKGKDLVEERADEICERSRE
jgi:hypothetical protein